ncbi:MAG: hypothetical protein SF339_00695 [Blastocatellia bacterium]|nr:hypothetical protein [Blastocatellia bacterium]
MIKQSTLMRSVALPILMAAVLLAFGSVSAQGQVTVVNAASFDAGKVMTPDAIGAAFGTFTTQNNQVYVAPSVPLPTTLGGVRVRVANTDAQLFFVAPSQINFLVPANVADGANVSVTVTNSNNSTTTGTFTVVRSAVGVFSAKANGQGAAAAVTTFDGAVYQAVANPDGTERDVDPGTTARPNVLVLYATGLRNTPAANPTDGNGVAESVTVTFQGVAGNVLYAGAAPGLIGTDQINVIIPPEMAGLGSVRVSITAGGRTSNPITIKIGGRQPDVRASVIAFGQTLTGDLATTDQVQLGLEGKTYFFDAFRFTTTAANTSVAIDLRSTAFDAGVLLYRVDRVNNIDQLTLIGADDQSGGYGNGRIDNNNALLIMVLPTAGDYVAFASTSDNQPNGVGAYSIRVLNNVATQIAYGQAVANPAIATTDLQTSAGTYLDLYWFNGVNQDNIQASMGSTVTGFDSFVILQGNDGDPPIASDDNTGGGSSGRDARLTSRLTRSGIFFIIATPFEPNRTGAYTFSLNKLTLLAGEGDEQMGSVERAPGREIVDERPGAASLRGSTFERFGRRRILERK